MVLTRDLRAALVRFNPGLPADAYDDAVRQIVGASFSQNLVAVDLLETLKTEKLRIDHWQEKEATRDAVFTSIHDFLWSEQTGLPVDVYSEEDVRERAAQVYRHVFRVYPRVPSPVYGIAA